jgi:hypothetical protein
MVMFPTVLVCSAPTRKIRTVALRVVDQNRKRAVEPGR